MEHRVPHARSIQPLSFMHPYNPKLENNFAFCYSQAQNSPGKMWVPAAELLLSLQSLFLRHHEQVGKDAGYPIHFVFQVVLQKCLGQCIFNWGTKMEM